jgi:TolA-binding protein
MTTAKTDYAHVRLSHPPTGVSQKIQKIQAAQVAQVAQEAQDVQALRKELDAMRMTIVRMQHASNSKKVEQNPSGTMLQSMATGYIVGTSIGGIGLMIVYAI